MGLLRRRINDDGALQPEREEEAPFGVEALTERVREELLDIATTEDGTPLQYPAWAARQFVKLQILYELGLLDDRLMEAHGESRGDAASDPDRGELATARYTAELDRVIEENGLRDVVEQVCADVLTTDTSQYE